MILWTEILLPLSLYMKFKFQMTNKVILLVNYIAKDERLIGTEWDDRERNKREIEKEKWKLLNWLISLTQYLYTNTLDNFSHALPHQKTYFSNFPLILPSTVFLPPCVQLLFLLPLPLGFALSRFHLWTDLPLLCFAFFTALSKGE